MTENTTLSQMIAGVTDESCVVRDRDGPCQPAICSGEADQSVDSPISASQARKMDRQLGFLTEQLWSSFSVEEFLIPASQEQMLDDIESWDPDYRPMGTLASSLVSDMEPPEVEAAAVSSVSQLQANSDLSVDPCEPDKECLVSQSHENLERSASLSQRHVGQLMNQTEVEIAPTSLEPQVQVGNSRSADVDKPVDHSTHTPAANSIKESSSSSAGVISPSLEANITGQSMLLPLRSQLAPRANVYCGTEDSPRKTGLNEFSSMGDKPSMTDVNSFDRYLLDNVCSNIGAPTYHSTQKNSSFPDPKEGLDSFIGAPAYHSTQKDAMLPNQSEGLGSFIGAPVYQSTQKDLSPSLSEGLNTQECRQMSSQIYSHGTSFDMSPKKSDGTSLDDDSLQCITQVHISDQSSPFLKEFNKDKVNDKHLAEKDKQSDFGQENNSDKEMDIENVELITKVNVVCRVRSESIDSDVSDVVPVISNKGELAARKKEEGAEVKTVQMTGSVKCEDDISEEVIVISSSDLDTSQGGTKGILIGNGEKVVDDNDEEEIVVVSSNESSEQLNDDHIVKIKGNVLQPINSCSEGLKDSQILEVKSSAVQASKEPRKVIEYMDSSYPDTMSVQSLQLTLESQELTSESQALMQLQHIEGLNIVDIENMKRHSTSGPNLSKSSLLLCNTQGKFGESRLGETFADDEGNVEMELENEEENTSIENDDNSKGVNKFPSPILSNKRTSKSYSAKDSEHVSNDNNNTVGETGKDKNGHKSKTKNDNPLNESSIEINKQSETSSSENKPKSSWKSCATELNVLLKENAGICFDFEAESPKRSHTLRRKVKQARGIDQHNQVLVDHVKKFTDKRPMTANDEDGDIINSSLVNTKGIAFSTNNVTKRKRNLEHLDSPQSLVKETREIWMSPGPSNMVVDRNTAAGTSRGISVVSLSDEDSLDEGKHTPSPSSVQKARMKAKDNQSLSTGSDLNKNVNVTTSKEDTGRLKYRSLRVSIKRLPYLYMGRVESNSLRKKLAMQGYVCSVYRPRLTRSVAQSNQTIRSQTARNQLIFDSPAPDNRKNLKPDIQHSSSPNVTPYPVMCTEKMIEKNTQKNKSMAVNSSGSRSLEKIEILTKQVSKPSDSAGNVSNTVHSSVAAELESSINVSDRDVSDKLQSSGDSQVSSTTDDDGEPSSKDVHEYLIESSSSSNDIKTPTFGSVSSSGKMDSTGKFEYASTQGFSFCDASNVSQRKEAGFDKSMKYVGVSDSVKRLCQESEGFCPMTLDESITGLGDCTIMAVSNQVIDFNASVSGEPNQLSHGSEQMETEENEMIVVSSSSGDSYVNSSHENSEANQTQMLGKLEPNVIAELTRKNLAAMTNVNNVDDNHKNHELTEKRLQVSRDSDVVILDDDADTSSWLNTAHMKPSLKRAPVERMLSEESVEIDASGERHSYSKGKHNTDDEPGPSKVSKVQKQPSNGNNGKPAQKKKGGAQSLSSGCGNILKYLKPVSELKQKAKRAVSSAERMHCSETVDSRNESDTRNKEQSHEPGRTMNSLRKETICIDSLNEVVENTGLTAHEHKGEKRLKLKRAVKEFKQYKITEQRSTTESMRPTNEKLPSVEGSTNEGGKRDTKDQRIQLSKDGKPSTVDSEETHAKRSDIHSDGDTVSIQGKNLQSSSTKIVGILSVNAAIAEESRHSPKSPYINQIDRRASSKAAGGSRQSPKESYETQFDRYRSPKASLNISKSLSITKTHLQKASMRKSLFNNDKDVDMRKNVSSSSSLSDRSQSLLGPQPKKKLLEFESVESVRSPAKSGNRKIDGVQKQDQYNKGTSENLWSEPLSMLDSFIPSQPFLEQERLNEPADKRQNKTVIGVKESINVKRKSPIKIPSSPSSVLSRTAKFVISCPGSNPNSVSGRSSKKNKALVSDLEGPPLKRVALNRDSDSDSGRSKKKANYTKRLEQASSNSASLATKSSDKDSSDDVLHSSWKETLSFIDKYIPQLPKSSSERSVKSSSDSSRGRSEKHKVEVDEQRAVSAVKPGHTVSVKVENPVQYSEDWHSTELDSVDRMLLETIRSSNSS